MTHVTTGVRACAPVWTPPSPRARPSRATTRRRWAGVPPLLERFPRRKRRHRFGRNVDGLSRAGIPSRPRWAVTELEAAKAPQFHGFAGLQGVHNHLQALREHRVGLGLRALDGGGHVVDELCLGHTHLLSWRRGHRRGLGVGRAVARGERTQAAAWCQGFCSIVGSMRTPHVVHRNVWERLAPTAGPLWQSHSYGNRALWRSVGVGRV